MKNIKTWIVSIIIACFLASISFGFASLLVASVKTINTVNQLIKRPSYDYLKSMTVRIIQKVDEGVFIGTGTIVKITDNYTYILTNGHVAPLDNKDRIFVVNEANIELKAEVISNSHLVDLSLIRVNGKIENKTTIKGIGKITYSEKGYSVGMYLGYDYIYTEGTFAGYDEDNNFVMNIPGAGGCSGSGVFNNKGELVAVIFAGNYIQYPYQVETAKLLCINTSEVEMFLYLNEELMI
jgi:S1-C subfamily serine protease